MNSLLKPHEISQKELRITLIGRTEYTFTENEKVKILTLSNETNNFYYITFDKDTTSQDVGSMIGMIKRLAGERSDPNSISSHVDLNLCSLQTD